MGCGYKPKMMVINKNNDTKYSDAPIKIEATIKIIGCFTDNDRKQMIENIWE